MANGVVINPDTPGSRIIILGAGRSLVGDMPSAMVSIDSGSKVLDWLLSSFGILDDSQVFYVGGYRVSEVEARYPNIRFYFNPDWEETGPAKSLSIVPLNSRVATYVSYSDVLFRPDCVARMDQADTDLVLAVDTHWRVRYEGRSPAELDQSEKVLLEKDRVMDVGRHVPTSDAAAEFSGLMKLSPNGAALLTSAIKAGEFADNAGLPAIIDYLLQQGISASMVDVQGDWAELNAPQDLARFVLGTKAESLDRLRPLIQTGEIGEQVSFTYASWKDNPKECIDRVREIFQGEEVIVRSSALSEDNWLQSSAGAFTSLLNIPSSDPEALESAITEVFESYGDHLGENQVLIQKMLVAVTMSGVLMTRTPTLGAPYYVINFDDTSSRTDTVTAGDGQSIRTVFLHRDASLRPDLPDQLHKLLRVVRELEELVGHDSLDIEFAFTQEGMAHILQVRPIAVSNRDQPIDDSRIAEGIRDAVQFFREHRKSSPFLMGRTTQLSVMADWNPAEMIGTKPGRLAFSLYRYLITDEPWAQMRAEYGYRDVRPTNLIIDILGHPFIDVRTTFNSFIPASVPDELAERLVNYYLGHLADNPELHDKVEFDVLYTCMTFDFDQKAERLREAGFSPEDVSALKEGLLEITRNGINRCVDDVCQLKSIENRFSQIMETELLPLERAYFLLEDVKRLAVPLFSHLARHAFIAVTLLKSLQSSGMTTLQQNEEFLASIRTVPSAMQQHVREVREGQLTWNEFVEIYGHLRPGSYDITSANYASAPDEFLRPMVESHADDTPHSSGNSWDEGTRGTIEHALNDLGFGGSIDSFEEFLRKSIEGREFGKFTFMRNVNAALEALAEYGENHGISREELAFIKIQDLMGLRGASPLRIKEHLKNLSRIGREASYVTQAVCFPGQVFSELDLTCFEQLKAEPNFVSRKKVRSDVVNVSGQTSASVDLSDKIVLVPNADPGYDWLFSRDIAGLITMYGGANSHMAIRAAEFQLPAAIGVGELLFENISRAKVLELDCDSRQIRVVG